MKSPPSMSMAWRSSCLLGLGALSYCASGLEVASQQRVSPVEKVVQMMQELVSKAEKEKHEEQVQYAAFEQFCSDVSLEKGKEVDKLGETKGLIETDLQKAQVEADRLAGEITGHLAEIDQFNKEAEAASVARDQEQQDYLAMHQNFTESVQAIEKALVTLKNQNFDRSGVSPMQLLQEDPDLTFLPEVPTTAYAPKSSEVIKMLEDLQGKFRDKLSELDKAEVSRKHAADMLQQDYASSTAAAEGARDSKTESKARHERKAAQLGGDLQDVSNLLQQTTEYLSELNMTCTQKKTQFDSRQSLRAEEIAALERATEILSSDEVKVAAARRSATPAAKAASMLLQVLRKDIPESNQLKAAAFLRSVSARLDSSALSTLAVRLQEDPLGKVKTLIEELIERLKTEALRETEHKGWCDKELATNEHTRKSKTQLIDGLRTDVDSLDADIMELAKDIEDLTTEINATETAMAEAETLRAQEKAENEQAIDEARKGQAAIAEAATLLQEFYANASTATAFAQARQAPAAAGPAHPEIFGDEPFQGSQAASGGILGMLEVIRADFARVESDTSSAEDSAQTEHGNFMQESKVSKTAMETDRKHKKKAHSDNEASLMDKKDDLEKAEAALSAAEEEYEKLKGPCMNPGQTYEERVAMRKDEIEALKQALEILSGATPAA